MAKNLMLFTGNANPQLASEVARELGVSLGKADVNKFSDGEISVEIQENVRGKDCLLYTSDAADES